MASAHSTFRSQDQVDKVLQLNNEASELAVDGKYEAAARKEIRAYRLITDRERKAMQAFLIGNTYESAADYGKAAAWYRRAVRQYKALGDDDMAMEARDSVKRVNGYARSERRQSAEDSHDPHGDAPRGRLVIKAVSRSGDDTAGIDICVERTRGHKRRTIRPDGKDCAVVGADERAVLRPRSGRYFLRVYGGLGAGPCFSKRTTGFEPRSCSRVEVRGDTTTHLTWRIPAFG